MPAKYSVDAPPKEKTCRDCQKTQSIDSFGKNRSRPDGLMIYCKPCACERAKASARKNPERIKAYNKAYNESHRAERAANWQRWYLANRDHLAAYRAGRPEQEKAYQQTTRDRHREKRLASDRERYWANPERRRAKTRKWQKANPDKVRQQLQRRKALMLAATTEPTDYDAILRRDRWICGICGKKVQSRAELHFDHITPLSKQGAHAEWNIQVSHARCNLVKQDKLIGQPRLPI